MSLHWALAIVGLLIIFGVILITKLPDWASRLKLKVGQKKTHQKSSQKARTARRSSDYAPVFSDNESGGEQGQGEDSVAVEAIDDLVQAGSDEPTSQPGEPTDQPADQPVDRLDRTESENKGEVEEPVTKPEKSPSSPFASLRQIDYWAKLTGRSRHGGEVIRKFIADQQAPFDAVVAIHGLALPDLEWRNLLTESDDGEYKDLVIAVQLVNQGTAMSIEELKRFQSWVKTLAEKTNSETYFMATPEQAAEQAQQLAEFVADCRGAMEVAIVSNDASGFNGRLIESSARQQGLDIENGKLVRVKAMGNTPVVLYEAVQLDGSLFPETMTADVSIGGVKFRMIPALTQKPGRVAKEMLDALKVFNSRVSGNIQVPGYEEYQQEQLTDLVNHLSKLEAKMVDAGIEPGGAEALRIF